MTPRVETESGHIEGLTQDGIVRFAGVPYAAPPVAGRRFQAPQPVAPWAGVRPAQAIGPAAPQPASMLPDVPPTAEDCLTLNVWTPGLDGAQRPVMVWFHGGAFITGSGGQPSYDGAALARRGDVVVVTINYRLGALGFLYLTELLDGHPRLSNSDNLALRDQLAALRWVRENIAGFGGDPGNVTVFGESAGAMCIATLLACQEARGLFHRAIAQSGAAEHTIVPEDATEVAAAFLSALGGSPARPDVLWEAPVEALLSHQSACVRREVRRGHPGHHELVKQMGLGMVADGRLVPRDVGAALRAGTVPVPLIAGTNRDEWHFYIQFADRGKLQLDEDALRRVCARRAPGDGEAAVTHYLAQPHHRGRACWELLSAIEGDRAFRMPAIRLAEDHAAPVYAYLFERGSPLFDGQLGACHSVEIPYVFGLVDQPFGRAFCGEGPEVLALSERMMDAWVAFARSGTPEAAAGVSWPVYGRPERLTLCLGSTVRVESDPDGADRRFWEARRSARLPSD